MKINDTIIVDEILSVLKLAEYSFRSRPTAFDRRDVALYIQQIIDTVSEARREAYKEVQDEIRDLNNEVNRLKNENEDLS